MFEVQCARDLKGFSSILVFINHIYKDKVVGIEKIK